jgi:hypothetical protein
LKLDASGAHQWSRSFGDAAGGSGGNAVAVDGSGSIAITGRFGGVVDFGGGPITGVAGDVFVAKYGAGGAHQWSRGLGGTGSDDGFGIAMDGPGNVVVTGYFNGTVDFGDGPRTSAGENDIFVAKYSAVGGIHEWSQRFGNTDYDTGYDVAVDGSGNVLVTGDFRLAVDFGGGPLVSEYFFRDMVLAKYAPTTTGVGEMPTRRTLSLSASPNPFSPGTAIHYIVPAHGRVRVRVYDVRGRQVTTLVNEEQAAGPHTVRWEGRDETGAPVPPGLYFLKFEQGGSVGTTRVSLLE